MSLRIPFLLALVVVPVAYGLVAPPRPLPSVGFAHAFVGVGGSPQRIVAGDVDGDLDVDSVVLSEAPHGVRLTVLRNDGGGTFAPAWNELLPPLPLGGLLDLDLGDLDGDGDLDLMLSVGFVEHAVRLNAGDGTFDVAVPYGVGGQRVDNVLGDLDGDAVLDHACYEIELLGYFGSCEGQGDGTFGGFACASNPVTAGSGTDTEARLALGDVSGDGLTDLVMASSFGLLLSRGVGTGGFPTWQVPMQTLDPAGFRDVVVADLDGDGIVDIAATSAELQAAAVLLGASGGPTSAVLTPTAPGPDRIAIADLTQDGIPDLIVTHPARGVLRWYEGAGGGAFLTPLVVPAGRQITDLVTADLDGDGDIDMALTDATGRVVLLFNQAVP